MVDAVSGQAALASLTGLSSADQLSKRKNPLLPNPLSESQQGGRQRASAILYFDRPRISPDVFSTLNNSALLSVSRRITTTEERTRLEAELRQRIQVTETGGSPGRPGTPDTFNTITIREGQLDPQSLDELQNLIDRLRRGGEGAPSRFIPQLSEELQRFGQKLGSQAQEALEGIIRRIETSVLGDGFDFSDFFRDPDLFFGIGFGLFEFSASTNHQAAHALRDVIRQLAQHRLHDGNPNNDSLQALKSSINRLGRALEDESNAGPALDRFLDRIGGAPSGGGDPYARRIADVLDAALADLRNGSLDLQAIERLQGALQSVQDLEDVAGQHDDRLRAETVEELQGILDRHATITERSETTVIPGQPAVPPTPGEKSITILEETRLVPKVEIAQRVVTIYQSVQESFRSLYELSEPPQPVPSLEPLERLQDEEDDARQRQDDEFQGPPRFGLPYLGNATSQAGIFDTRGVGAGTGQRFDSRV